MTPHWNEWNHEAHIQEDGNLVGMHSEDHVNGHRGKYEIRKGGHAFEDNLYRKVL